ncbi:MAG: hypothetical protein JWN22_2310 [Nocardioides sp.]|jgi:hypothetical protein|nr:hypothetical protein [Nocardioides sp.]
MRKTLTGIVASAALVASSLAGAATAATRVDGNHFAASGLTFVTHGCVDSRAIPVVPPEFVISRGPKRPPLGEHSVGWVMDGPTYGAGLKAHLADPLTLDSLRIALYSSDSDEEGVAVATYYAPGDDGVWQGIAALEPDAVRGWHPVEASDAVYRWVHFVGDTIDREDPDGTIQAMAARHGGSGAGADIGFMFGCNGGSFFVDDFRLSTQSQDKVYDLGGFRSRVTLFTHSKARNNLTLDYSEGVKVTAKVRSLSGNKTLSGPALVQSRPRSSAKWRTVDKSHVGRSGNFSFKAKPGVSSLYRVVYRGASQYEPGTSRPLRIFVRKKVVARLGDATVTRGHAVTTTGHLLPKRAGRVLLQRYARGDWRTVRRGQAGGSGAFRLSARSTRLGTSYWRVLASTGHGTSAGVSRAMKLVTRAPSSGGGGPTPPPPDDPPPPPPNVPPPPPGPQRSWVG